MPIIVLRLRNLSGVWGVYKNELSCVHLFQKYVTDNFNNIYNKKWHRDEYATF